MVYNNGNPIFEFFSKLVLHQYALLLNYILDPFLNVFNLNKHMCKVLKSLYTFTYECVIKCNEQFITTKFKFLY